MEFSLDLPQRPASETLKRDYSLQQVEALLGVKLTGSGKEQIILGITQIDVALGEKAKKDQVSGPKLMKILVFLSQWQ